jgi:hypothetical protein
LVAVSAPLSNNLVINGNEKIEKLRRFDSFDTKTELGQFQTF